MAIGSLKDFKAEIIPRFTKDYQPVSYRMFYTIKRLLADDMEMNEVIGNRIAGNLKGRHIIEFDLSFNHKSDF